MRRIPLFAVAVSLFRRARVPFADRWLLRAVLVSACVLRGAATEAIHGLPFTRTYPFEEIGNVPRGVRLNFDPFGRLAVVQEGVYTVLNDTVWVDRIDASAPRGMSMGRIVQAEDGQAYYGGRSSWGRVATGPNGRLRAAPLVPPDAPAWTAATSFNDLVATPEGVYFAGANGIVYWDIRRQQNQFFEQAGVATIFRTGPKVFVSCYGDPLRWIDVAHHRLETIPGTSFGGPGVDSTTPLNSAETLLEVRDGRLVVFDGHQAVPWPPQQALHLTGTISGLQHLLEGGVAVAIADKGLFLVSRDGELLSSVTTPQFQRITAMNAREPGVVWVATDEAIEKVLYTSPLTTFGQRLGLAVSWPNIVRWNGRTVVASIGRLYQAVTGPTGYPSRFEAIGGLPPGGAWVIAARDSRMLVGNATGVFAAEPDGRFERVISLPEVGVLYLLNPSLCFVIGRREIALLRYANGRWSEAAARVPGLGDCSVACASARAVWIELGANRVARLSFQAGRLNVRPINLPWKDTPWVNVGIIDDTVVLSGATEGRLFFDEQSESFKPAPEVQRLLERSPHWITRLTKDDTGTIWATYRQGVVTFTPRDGGFDVDSATFAVVNDYYPAVHVLSGNDVWLTAARSLYHVEHRAPVAAPGRSRPVLVSALDTRRDVELALRSDPAGGPRRLAADENNLGFRFFSGGYAWHSAPTYEYRIGDTEAWAQVDSSSLLWFPGLPDGAYRLQVRFAKDTRGPVTTIPFVISPPWFRTWPAFTLYGCASLLGMVGIVRWTSLRSHRRNLALEGLVQERTKRLEATMEKLNEETRYAATLAERNRLAGEIHDSMQQGLSGAILQLDTTLNLPAVTGDVRSRLDVVRNMVSYTREEVQHAVWNMESPLLENAELGEALRKLTAFVSGGHVVVDVTVAGDVLPLPTAMKHHLLRVAQEAMTNAVRHALPQRIAVTLEFRAESVVLAVVDDGIGFDPDEVLSKRIGHFGLRGLRARARKLGAHLLIQSSPGAGATVRVTVPLNPNSPHCDAKDGSG